VSINTGRNKWRERIWLLIRVKLSEHSATAKEKAAAVELPTADERNITSLRLLFPARKG
jgi:hypothetical protein